jgi:hypothetical protein
MGIAPGEGSRLSNSRGQMRARRCKEAWLHFSKQITDFVVAKISLGFLSRSGWGWIRNHGE